MPDLLIAFRVSSKVRSRVPATTEILRWNFISTASGNAHINWTPMWWTDAMPYGGLKGSGMGKEGPKYAVEEMTELKTVVIHSA